MPLSLAQAHVLIAAAHDHAVANRWKIAVAVVDEGGLLVALGRMDGAFPLAAQIAEAKAAGTALWHRDGDQLAASRASHEGFFDAVSRARPAAAHSRPRLSVDLERRQRAGRSRGERRERRRRPRLCRGRPTGRLSRLNATGARSVLCGARAISSLGNMLETVLARRL
jgi:Haem degrading protein HbpS-like